MMNKTMCATSKLLTLLIAILLYAQANAGILRLKPVAAVPVTLQGLSTEKSVVTTTLQNTEATFLPKDIDEKLLITTTIATATAMATTTDNNAEEDEDTTEIMVESTAALSRDEDATIKLAAKKNPNLDAEVLQIDTHKSDDAELSKLLLLSVPKTSEKSRALPEENIEEPKEITEEYKRTNHDDQSQTTTTELPFETTTTIDNKDNIESAVSEEEEENSSDLASERKSNEESIEATLAAAAVLETVEEEPHVDNAAHDGFEVHGYDDYVILDDHFERNVHLEPFVHSIEIVPPRFDNIILEDLVHDW